MFLQGRHCGLNVIDVLTWVNSVRQRITWSI